MQSNEHRDIQKTNNRNRKFCRFWKIGEVFRSSVMEPHPWLHCHIVQWAAIRFLHFVFLGSLLSRFLYALGIAVACHVSCTQLLYKGTLSISTELLPNLDKPFSLTSRLNLIKSLTRSEFQLKTYLPKERRQINSLAISSSIKTLLSLWYGRPSKNESSSTYRPPRQ